MKYEKGAAQHCSRGAAQHCSQGAAQHCSQGAAQRCSLGEAQQDAAQHCTNLQPVNSMWITARQKVLGLYAVCR